LAWQYLEDDASFQIEASVKQSRHVVVQYDHKESPTASGDSLAVVIRNKVESLAQYNRTFEHVLNLDTSVSNQSFTVGWSPTGDVAIADEGPCYSKQLHAEKGAIVQNFGKDTCTWPSGVYVCSSDLCGDYVQDASTAFGPGEPETQHHRSASQGLMHADMVDAELPFRGPQLFKGRGKKDVSFRAALHQRSAAHKGKQLAKLDMTVADKPQGAQPTQLNDATLSNKLRAFSARPHGVPLAPLGAAVALSAIGVAMATTALRRSRNARSSRSRGDHQLVRCEDAFLE